MMIQIQKGKNNMETVNIVIAGVGGQGTLLTSRILGGIAIQEEFDVKISEVHGMAQRGGSVVTYVRYGERVAEPIVEEGCADMLIAFERLEALRYAHFLKKDGIIICNNQRIDPMTVTTGKAAYPENIIENLSSSYKVVSLNAMEKAKELGNTRVFNTIIIGVAARHLEFQKEKWENVIRNTVPPKTIDINLKAFQAGYEWNEQEQKKA